MYRVLITEDEDIIRKGLVYSIPWKDMECTIVGEARNGEEGIQQIKEQRPDILLADINMPIMDGLEMIRRTYEEYDYSAIILSGYSTFEYAQQAILYGVLGYLLKPLKLSEMKDAVARARKEQRMLEAYINNQLSHEEWRQMDLIKESIQKAEHNLISKQMLEFIAKNYQNKIMMRDVVEAMNYSETFLNKTFKDAMGTTFIEYLNRYRMQKALEMLKGGMEVQEVAWRCGIGEYKYFGAVFKKYIGCSPKEYLHLINK